MIFSKKMCFSEVSGKFFQVRLSALEKNKPYVTLSFCLLNGQNLFGCDLFNPFFGLCLGCK